ncbi:tripartite tricarboxylate transporter TctB family protein [Azospira restricta]|uniref:tripartite tricarboxylate transporter TctB family protein n=1 Tax=Azospira restricta TaxID=404405 RepID=UPI001EF03767|nr:tripartite tricarboxylate transporter TctB family protein [Azospira restricta]
MVSERIFGFALLLLSVAGILIGWDLRAPVEYEPVGPRAFPLLLLTLLGVTAVVMIVSRPAPTKWAPPPVLRHVAALFVVMLVYAWLFDKLGFIVATALMTVPVARYFGGTWRQCVLGGIGLGVGQFFLFDKILDVALPTGLWLKPFLG